MRVCVCVIVCVPAPPTRLTCQPTMDNGHALFWHTAPHCHRPKLSATHFLTDFCVLLLVARPLTIRTECACVWTSMCVCVCNITYHNITLQVCVCMCALLALFAVLIMRLAHTMHNESRQRCQLIETIAMCGQPCEYPVMLTHIWGIVEILLSYVSHHFLFSCAATSSLILQLFTGCLCNCHNMFAHLIISAYSACLINRKA